MADVLDLEIEQAAYPSLNAGQVLQDYRIAYRSRQASLIGRREVMSGKAKFGIFGDGKEIPQVAMAHAFEKGDIRSGYYRDQTFMLAIGELTLQAFFAQLYAHADLEAEPSTAGRAMNSHFATRSLDKNGHWKSMTEQYNSSADISPTGSQMPRLVGLAYASRLYRQVEELKTFTQFSHNGDEVAFGTIGNASAAEGMFWESINAIGVLRAPAVITVYDDGYGISVPNSMQMVKGNISPLLYGFQRQAGPSNGFDVYTVRGWDYPALLETYRKAVASARQEHIPAILHVVELTQPQGHSTSGSHERYKSKERLEWELQFDGIKKFREWILGQNLASAEELDRMEEFDRQFVETERKNAWEAYINPILADRQTVLTLLTNAATNSERAFELGQIKRRLTSMAAPLRRDLNVGVHEALLTLREADVQVRQPLIAWKNDLEAASQERYDSYLYSQSDESALKIAPIPAIYAPDAPILYGYDILNACFDEALRRDPRVVAFGEDLGRLGDVNQGFHGLQSRYGDLRVSDTGIREATILGQAIGLALRGLRPIAEIQYLDYLLYALQIMSDDLATLQWRTRGGQKAPVIVRTRGHRLEGIWHSGSLMAGILNLLHGMYILVPRNMTQAAGFYNTLLRADEPALVVEVLNAYRHKARLPENIGEFTLPLGLPEILRSGEDVTLATYGACCRIALDAAELLQQTGIETEVIDVQSLLPFDLQGVIGKSLRKTSHIVFLDEDVPGGATAYMFQQVIEGQSGYAWLDSEPRTISGKEHRPAYGSDGDYWSKPNVEQVFETIYLLMNEVDPQRYPLFF